MVFELLKGERPVVQRRRQPKAKFHQGGLARAVSGIHSSDLGNCDVGLVDEKEEVVGEVVEKAGRRLSGLSAGENLE